MMTVKKYLTGLVPSAPGLYWAPKHLQGGRSESHLSQEPVKLAHVFPKGEHQAPTPNIQLITHTPCCLQSNQQKNTPHPLSGDFCPSLTSSLTGSKSQQLQASWKKKYRLPSSYPSLSKEKAYLSPIQTSPESSLGYQKKGDVNTGVMISF